RRDMSVGEIAKIELDSRTIEPVKRNLVDGPGAPASVHCGSKMPGRVDMGPVVRGDSEKFYGPRLSPRQLTRFQPRKHRKHPRQRLLVIGVLDVRPKPRRVRRYGV